MRRLVVYGASHRAMTAERLVLHFLFSRFSSLLSALKRNFSQKTITIF
jgi:hypothetical protein